MNLCFAENSSSRARSAFTCCRALWIRPRSRGRTGRRRGGRVALKIASFDNNYLRRVNVPPHRCHYLVGRERGYFLFKLRVPVERAVQEEIRGEFSRDTGVLSAVDLLSLKEARLGRCDFGVSETLSERALNLFAKRSLKPLHVLRRVDGERRETAVAIRRAHE